MRRYPASFATLLYLALGGGWVVLSDIAVRQLTASSVGVSAEQLQLFKGLLYVALTGALVFVLVRAATRTARRYTAELESQVRERTEELERRNRELELVNHDLLAFSSSVSHDLRAPVRAVSGFAQIVRQRYADTLPEEGRRYLDNIVDAGDRMDRLIEDLLRFARLGSKPADLRPLPIAPVVRRICAEQESAHGLAAGTVTLDERVCTALANESLLEQILSNLLENAVRYQSRQRPLEITVSTRCADGTVRVVVRDNGEGIAAEHHGRVFTLFQRLHPDESGGTGIGLTMARRAAEAMGGTLTLESQPGTGSAFVLSLPEMRP